jgi:hypothetical protein
MKILLLFILSVNVALAQEVRPIMNYKSLLSVKNKVSIEREYINWCYADSIFWGYQCYKPYVACIYDPSCNKYEAIKCSPMDVAADSIYIPHEYPSFVGFVKWREEEYGY